MGIHLGLIIESSIFNKIHIDFNFIELYKIKKDFNFIK